MNPPPGTYNPSDQQSRSGYGNYILSNFKTFGTTKIVPISGKGAHDGLFSRQSKDLFFFGLITFAATPGPGSYTLPSEFGQIIMPRKDEHNSQMGHSRIGSTQQTRFSSARRNNNRFNASEMQNRGRINPSEEELRFMANKTVQMSVPNSK
jgi:hypothetical protein